MPPSPATFRITDLRSAPPSVRVAAAALLVERMPEGWPSMTRARSTVEDMAVAERVARVAIASDGTVVGWCGAMEMYAGHVWELHPLVVARSHERRGVGRALVADIEARVVERGAHTIALGADDRRGETSMAGLDLFPDPVAHLARLEDLRGHPLPFYRRLGYAVIGCMPDANGFGKPDLWMAKRVAPPSR